MPWIGQIPSAGRRHSTGNKTGEPSAFPSYAKECRCHSVRAGTEAGKQECLQIKCFYLHGVPDGTGQRTSRQSQTVFKHNFLILFCGYLFLNFIQTVLPTPVWCCGKVQPNILKVFENITIHWYGSFIEYSICTVPQSSSSSSSSLMKPAHNFASSWTTWWTRTCHLLSCH